jgi:hypothetical protein
MSNGKREARLVFRRWRRAKETKGESDWRVEKGEEATLSQAVRIG